MEAAFTRTLRNIFFILFGLFFILLLYISHLMRGFLVPIFFAFFTALLLHPFIHKLHQTRIPNWLSTVIVYLVFLVLVSFILLILGFSVSNFAKDLDDITRDFRKSIESLIIKISQMELVKSLYKDENIKQQMLKSLLDITTTVVSIENFRTYIIKPVGVTLDIIRGFGLYALALIFIIPGVSRFSGNVVTAFPGKRGEKINEIITNIMDQIQSYMTTKSIISLATGIISFLICVAFGVKYALLWGAVIFLFNYMPIIGSIIAVIFPITLSIIQYQSAVHFIFLSILLISVQLIIGNIIEPTFMSKGVNLSPLVIFISLLIWGYIWGIAGIILAVPIMSAINLICENIEQLKPVSIFISAKAKKPPKFKPPKFIFKNNKDIDKKDV